MGETVPTNRVVEFIILNAGSLLADSTNGDASSKGGEPNGAGSLLYMLYLRPSCIFPLSRPTSFFLPSPYLLSSLHPLPILLFFHFFIPSTYSNLNILPISDPKNGLGSDAVEAPVVELIEQDGNVDMLRDRGRKPKCGRKQKLYIIETNFGFCKVGVTILTQVELLKRYVVPYGKIRIRLFPMKYDSKDDPERYKRGRNLMESYFKRLVCEIFEYRY